MLPHHSILHDLFTWKISRHSNNCGTHCRCDMIIDTWWCAKQLFPYLKAGIKNTLYVCSIMSFSILGFRVSFFTSCKWHLQQLQYWIGKEWDFRLKRFLPVTFQSTSYCTFHLTNPSRPPLNAKEFDLSRQDKIKSARDAIYSVAMTKKAGKCVIWCKLQTQVAWTLHMQGTQG